MSVARAATRGWRRLRRNPITLVGFAVVAMLGLVALSAPVLPLPDPHATNLALRLAPPFSGDHLLGTDHLGRDLLARLVWGTRASLSVGLFATAVAALFGSLIGFAAGYAGRWTDGILMRTVDVLMAFPYLLLALAIVAALGPGLRNAMIAIAVVNVPFFARAVRGSVLGLKHRPFVDAARLLGQGTPRILLAEILPNVLPAIVIMMGTTLGWMVLETAGLSFLGLGAQPPAADLGSMLGQGREFLTTVPRVALLPGLVILTLVIGINLLGDGLRDALDPRYAGTVRSAIRPPGPRPTAKGPARAAREDDSRAPLLVVDELAVRFERETQAIDAVRDVGFELARGERVALVGESGSGKTLTALAVLGLIPAPGRVDGSVRLHGEELTMVHEARLQRLRGDTLAYVPQDPSAALDPLFTVGAQLEEVLHRHQRLTSQAARKRARELLEQVRLADAARVLQARPHELSGGMRQRVVIALAIANEPELLIADEATTALDVTVQAGVINLLDELCDRHSMALLFITHDLGLGGELCDRAMVLYSGRVVESQSVAGLFDHPYHPYTRALLACVPVLGGSRGIPMPIPGTPPTPLARPTGCHFAPRCEYAQPRCRAGEIALRTVDGVRVRCVRAEELV